MLESLSALSLGALFEKLHNSLRSLASELDGVIEQNRSIPFEEIEALRIHIQERLEKREEIDDNKKLLRLLELLYNDETVLRIIKENTNDWLRFMDMIEDNLISRSNGLTEEEKKEISQIRELSGGIRELFRR